MDLLPFPRSQPATAVAVAPGVAVCPLCHTPSARLETAADAGVNAGYWQCGRCLQTWSAQRLETVGAYQRLTF